MLACLALRDFVTISLLMANSHAEATAHDKVKELFENNLPPKWWDGQTSDQSWEHVWEEVRIQIENFVEFFTSEAKHVAADNPDFSA